MLTTCNSVLSKQNLLYVNSLNITWLGAWILMKLERHIQDQIWKMSTNVRLVDLHKRQSNAQLTLSLEVEFDILHLCAYLCQDF